MRPLVAVRPPEYWPRPLFVALMDAADKMVLADTFLYSRQSRQNRTLVRTPSGRQWLSIPLAAGGQGRSIREIEIRGPVRWIRKHWRAFAYNYRTTPFFEFYEPELAPFFEREWDCLGALTCASVQKVAELFGIETPLVRASEVEGAPIHSPRYSCVDRRCFSFGGRYCRSRSAPDPGRRRGPSRGTQVPAELRRIFSGDVRA